MSNVVRWNPYDELQRVRDEIAGIFAPFFGWAGRGEPLPGRFTPSVDVTETPSEVVIRAEVPGVDPQQLEVHLSEDTLTLRGRVEEQREENETGFRRVERRYGAFERSISMPVPVRHQEARASCRNGVLEIHVPKAGPDRTNSTRLRIESDAPPRPQLPPQ